MNNLSDSLTAKSDDIFWILQFFHCLRFLENGPAKKL